METEDRQARVRSPYRGILPFRYVDRENFFGQQESAQDLYAKILLYRLVVLFGESGAGKSSLLNAKLIPEMQNEGLNAERIRIRPIPDQPLLVERIPATGREDREFLTSIFADLALPEVIGEARVIPCPIEGFLKAVQQRAATARPLLIFDQFEELFTLFESAEPNSASVLSDLQARLFETIVQIAGDEALRAKIVIVIREDFLGKLEVLAKHYPRVLDYRVRLHFLTPQDAERAIVGPFEEPRSLPSRLTQELAQRIVSDLSAGQPNSLISPTQLQIVCRRLWDNYACKVPEIGVREYEQLGAVAGIVHGFFSSELERIEPRLQRLAVLVLGNLITDSDTRDVVSQEKLQSLLTHEEPTPERTRSVLTILEARRLINKTAQRGTFFYEVASEYLIEPIQKREQELMRQIEMEKAQRRAATEAAERAKDEARRREVMQARELAAEQQKSAEAERARAELERTRAEAALEWTAVEARLNQRLRRRMVVLYNLAVFALVAAGLAGWQWKVAVDKGNVATMQTVLAREQTKLAEARAERIRESLALKQAALSPNAQEVEAVLRSPFVNRQITFRVTATPLNYRDSADREIFRFQLFPDPQSVPGGLESLAFITFRMGHPTFKNTLLPAGPDRQFTATYDGWGCLTRVIAVIEFKDPDKPANVASFNMCEAESGKKGPP